MHKYLLLTAMLLSACGGFGGGGDPTEFVGTYAGSVSWQRTFGGATESFSAPDSMRIALAPDGSRLQVGVGICSAVDDQPSPAPRNLIFEAVSPGEIEFFVGSCVYQLGAQAYSGLPDARTSFAMLDGDSIELEIRATLDAIGDAGTLTATFTGVRGGGSAAH